MDASTTYDSVVKWLRRGSSLATNAVLLSLVRWEAAPASHIARLVDDVAQLVGIPTERLLAALIIAWCLYLTQLRPRWFLFLPVYLLVWPWWWLSSRLFSVTVVPVLRRLGVFGQHLSTSAPTRARRRFRTFLRFTWLALFVAWAVVPSGSDLGWPAWIPPSLWLPFWWYLLRLAYKAAIFPSALVGFVTKIANGLLDRQMDQFRKAVDKRKRPSSAAPFYSAITGVVGRYSDDRLLAIVQREALLYFSLVLVACLAASSVFWGLVGHAILQTMPEAMTAYDFFTLATLGESVLWAWGCMTTTIEFPGQGAGLWLKVLHAGILATGLFQLTFLISSFAVLTPADAERNADVARIALQLTRKKVEIVQELEKKILALSTHVS